MGSIERRLRALEAQADRGGAAHHAPLYLDVYFKELENIRRGAAGLEPLPFTEEEEEYRREADRWFRDEYLPGQRARSDLSGDARAILDELEAHTNR